MAAVRFLDQTLFAQLASDAKASGRQRYHHLLHRADEPCQRLVAGLQPDTYIAPHRHLAEDKAEHLIVLRGRLGLVLFEADGQILRARELSAAGDCCGVDIPPGLYHALVVLTPDSILFECKAGPYQSLRPDERAPWAPGEGDPAADEYRQWLCSLFAR